MEDFDVIIFFAMMLFSVSKRGIWWLAFFIGGKIRLGDENVCLCLRLFICTSFWRIFSFSISIWDDFLYLWYYFAFVRSGIDGL